MTNIFSSKLVTFSALAVFLSLCVPNCLSSVVGSSGNSIAMVRASGPAISKANSIQETCDSILDCMTYSYKSGHCWHGQCYYCDLYDEYFDLTDGRCEDWDDGGVAVGVIIALAICIPFAIIAGIVACCCCCAGCAGHRYRQRRNQQPTQIIVTPNAAYNQHGNPIQYQYAAAPPNNGQYPNAPVQAANGPAHYPVQQQNVYQNVDQNTHS